MTRGAMTRCTTSLRTAAHGGLVHLLGDPREEEAVPVGHNILGMGSATVAAFAVALVQGRSASLIRETPKDHGTCRQIDGVHDESLPCVVYFTSEADRAIAETSGVDVRQWVRVPTVGGWPDRLNALPAHPLPHHPVSDFRAYAHLLRGGVFTRSSGQLADHYFETLHPAHTYDVAAAFASVQESSGPWSAAVGIRWGGVYLAAAVALRYGLPLLMADPDSSPLPASPSVPGPPLLVDDLVNTGRAFARCEPLLLAAGLYHVKRTALYALSRSKPAACGAVAVCSPLVHEEFVAAPRPAVGT